MPSTYLALRLNQCDAPPEGFASRIDNALPFEPDRRFSKQSGRLFLWAFVRDESLWPAPLWHDAGESAAALTGYAVDDDDRLLAASDACEPDLTGLWRRFHGEWSACRLDPDGISAVSGDNGTEHLYLAQNAHFTGVSNRARLLWEAMKAFGARVEPDLQALAGLISIGYPLCTDATAVRGISLVDSTSLLRVPREPRPHELVPIDPHYFLPKGEAPSWDALAARLRANAAWYGHITKPLLAALTGGKDSRLVLAMLRSAGLADKVSFYISAPPEHADALAAKMIADRLKLRFEREERHRDTRLLEVMRRHVALTEGALNAMDLTGAATYHSRVGLHGLFGELYRGRGTIYPDARAAARSVLSAVADLGLLRPEIKRAQNERAIRWFETQEAQGITPDRARDAFYARQFVPRWIGQARLGDGLTALVTNPLYHRSIQQAYAALPHADRVGERVHFELTRRLCPELIDLPFAQAQWSAEMLRRSGQPASIAAAPLQHLRPMVGIGWQIPALVSQWQRVRASIEAGVPDLESIVRPARVTALLDVAEVILGVQTSTAAWTRAALRHPALLARASSRKGVVVRLLLGLLTLCGLCDELRADAPSLVKVT